MSRAAQELARSLEATLVRPVALAAAVEELAARALELACAAVVVLPPLVATARAHVGRGPVHVVAVVGLPFGADGAKAMAATCAQAVADGADVLDVVASLPLLANGDFPGARDELAAAVAAAAAAARAGRQIVVRAVIETCYLEPAAWRLAARLVASAGCDGVVCATGLGPEGATPAAIAALRAELPAGSALKAQGGIRSLADARRALEAGADLLGVADPVSLLAELAEAPGPRRRPPAE
ncbi:MAG: deoxyribose-phosphate aldolase [Gaiellales bacterium]|nr:deoxyribose-phosphate aldolase [Gaiellales bacterium]